MVVVGLVALAVVASVPWIRTVRRGEPLDVLELVYPFSLLYFFEYGGRMIWLLLRPGALAAQTPHPSVILAALGPTLAVAVGGLAAYLGGYYGAGRWLRMRDRDPRSPLAPAVLACVAIGAFAVGVAARAPMLLRGWYMNFAAVSFAREVPPAVHSLGYLGALTTVGYALAVIAFLSPHRPRWLGWVLFGVIGPLETLNTVGYALAVIAFLSPHRPRWLGWVLFGVIGPLETLNTFLTGSKFAFLTLVLIPLVAVHYLRRSLRLQTLAIVTAAFLLVVVPLITAYRGVVAVDGPKAFALPESIPTLLGRVVSRFVTLSPSAYADATMGVVVSRFIGIDAVASVVGAIPVLTPYLRGESLLWAGKILVPTVLWPEKYDALQEVLRPVSVMFGFSDFSRGGLSITLPGELYWNFGPLGVLAGMGVVGVLQYALVWLLRQRGDPGRIGAYALVWVWVVLSFEGWFYVVFSNVLRILVMVLAAVWLAARLSVRREPAEARA